MPKKRTRRTATRRRAAVKVRTPERRGHGPLYPSDARITVLVEENPHRVGSGRYRRWSKYRTGMTVAEALKAGLNRANLRWSVLDGHISISWFEGERLLTAEGASRGVQRGHRLGSAAGGPRA